MIKRIKRAIRKLQTIVQKAIAKNIDYLYQDSPYNKLMVYLDKKEDYANYDVYTNYRKAFEKKVLKIASRFAYVRLFGVLYHFNRFKDYFALREACADHTGLNSRMRFSIEILKQHFADAKDVYLTEHGTHYYNAIVNNFSYNLTTSIYKAGHALHQDMTCLTFADNSFDLCMTYEDLEHIPDYKAVIRELYRVTKPAGHVLLSTPFKVENDETIVRASVNDKGEITHHRKPQYHGDPVVPQGILSFYYFGWDLLDEFRKAGFSSVKLLYGYDIDKLILDRLVYIVAQK
jgi:SAM-dependent methyltransferase